MDKTQCKQQAAGMDHRWASGIRPSGAEHKTKTPDVQKELKEGIENGSKEQDPIKWLRKCEKETNETSRNKKKKNRMIEIKQMD